MRCERRHACLPSARPTTAVAEPARVTNRAFPIVRLRSIAARINPTAYSRLPTAALPMPTRALILAHARSWLGTPYHHQASTPGAGCDCVGLVRGVWRALYGHEAEALPAYTRDWAEAAHQETMLAAARRHLVEIAPADAQPGDVLIFRFRARTMAKHAAILSGTETMIHALEGAAVSEVPLNGWWRRRIAGAFAFPGVID